MSGLKVNFHKSKLVGVNIDEYALNTYAKTLNCNSMRLPFQYLGVEVGENLRTKQFWEPVVKKIEAKLTAWKGKLLSMAGRVCLLKSVFTSIPLFYLSIFRAPVAVCNRINSIQRRFLWAWGKENKAIAWVSWENVCKPCEEGGLGIKETRSFNSALLTKWKWRLLGEAGGKWKEILISFYGSETGRGQVGLKYQSWWWRDLAKVCGESDQEQGWFGRATGWKAGDGSRVKLWEDVWLQSSSLKSMFPRV